MSTRRDPDQLIHAFLMEGQTELADQVFDAVRTDIEHTRQRVVIGLWRIPDIMSRLVVIGLGAAAVVAALIIGTQIFGTPAPGGVGTSPTASPSPIVTPAPSSEAWVGIPRGPFVVTGARAPVQVTVSIASPGWTALPGYDALSKNDDGLDPPVAVGAAFLAWTWPTGTGFNVYGDPCHWTTTIPETPATTPGEIAAALAAQASTNPTAPVDVTVGGFAGKAITVHVPMSFDLPSATREKRFAACDQNVFAFYGIEGEAGEARNAQGAGQVDDLWILDVSGRIVILDAAYGPAVPAQLVAEMRTIAGSATFEVP